MNARGKSGEDLALRYLESKGFALLCRNYRSRYGEIDMILENGEYIVFVEVKARGARALDSPGASVTPAKQRKIIQTALLYLAERPSSRQPRFDVVEIVYSDGAGPEISHLENAFFAEGAGF